jgi:hypothetical protein
MVKGIMTDPALGRMERLVKSPSVGVIETVGKGLN